eukprot:TRINITY_DN380_c0_g1_i1.p1 TRINITY_DN380_c0_g1~~TRINITY_DN380_c0_g1_i1.p1  ORF type:complete len:560 (+),score=240.87 TRINITY_DN380_c0_g1_i1:504-2183(+)
MDTTISTTTSTTMTTKDVCSAVAMAALKDVERLARTDERLKEKVMSYIPQSAFQEIVAVSKEWRNVFLGSRVALDFSKANRACRSQFELQRKAIRKSRKLRSLKVRSYLLTDQAVSDMFRGFTTSQSLTSLSLDSGLFFSSVGLADLLKTTPLLETLELACPKFDDACLQAISKHLPRLRELILKNCSAVTDVGMTYLANSPSLASLRVLVLKNNSSITPKGIKILSGSRYLRLETLVFESFDSLSSEGLLHLANSPLVTNVSTLKLVECYEIDDACLRSIASAHRLKNLRHLDISYCNQITDEGIRQLSATPKPGCCPSQLISLNVSGIDRLTDKATGSICTGLRQLHELTMQHSHGVTDQSLHLIGQNLTNLLYLNVRGCENLTDHGVLQLISPDFSSRLSNIQTLILGDRCKLTTRCIKHILTSPNSKKLQTIDLRIPNCTDHFRKSFPSLVALLSSSTHLAQTSLPLIHAFDEDLSSYIHPDTLRTNLPDLTTLNIIPLWSGESCVQTTIPRPSPPSSSSSTDVSSSSSCSSAVLIRTPETFIRSLSPAPLEVLS